LAILVGLHHVTRYTYDGRSRWAAVDPPSTAPIAPRVPSYSLKVTPANHFVNCSRTARHWLARYVFPEPVEESRSRSISRPNCGHQSFDFFVEPTEEFPFAYSEELGPNSPLSCAEPNPLLKHTGASRHAARPTIRFWSPHAECNGWSITSSAWSGRSGSERRSPALGSCATRHGCWCRSAPARLAARSSPLSHPAQGDVDPIEGRAARTRTSPTCTRGGGLYPGAGWIGMDATSGLFCGEGHLPLCATPTTARRADHRLVEPAQSPSASK